MTSYLNNRNIELLQKEIEYLEKRKTIIYALRNTVLIVAIVFGVELFSTAFFQTKSVAIALQQYNWGRLLRVALFWFVVNYFWGVRSNKKRLVTAKAELERLKKEKSIQEAAS